MVDNDTPTLEQLRNLASSILDCQYQSYSLRQEVIEMTALLARLGTIPANCRANISDGETQTANGLALSPVMAAMCAADFVRTIEFLRGTYAAIMDLRKLNPGCPTHVLYVGCGPYAALAIPLMTMLSPNDAMFTLLDIHPDSIESAKAIVEALELTAFVNHYETTDASCYRVHSGRMPDIILMEMLQACLEAEPQVAITRHLLAQAPNAVLIPEDLRVDLNLVDLSREFDLEGLVMKRGDNLSNRFPLGSVFAVNRERVQSWQHISGNRLPGASVQMPPTLPQPYQPMLFTVIRVYRDHVLKDYDSGLTCPKTFPSRRPIKSGETIQFYYALGRRPGLKSELC